MYHKIQYIIVLLGRLPTSLLNPFFCGGGGIKIVLSIFDHKTIYMNRLKVCKNLDPYKVYMYTLNCYFFLLITSVSLYWAPNYFAGKLPVAHTSTKLTGTLHCLAYFIAKALQIKRGATKSCICIGSLHCSACVKDNRKEYRNLLITSLFAREERGH